ncbi:MAG: hypothetical protein RIR46_739 [Actinomycetota bacterium]
MTEKKTKAVKAEKAPTTEKVAGTTKPKGSRAWIYATVGVAAALIGGVVFYGQVIYPDVRSEQIAKNNVIACTGFYEALRAEKDGVDDAVKKVLNASDDAIELYDPEFNDSNSDYGLVYESFLRLSDAGFSALTGDVVLGLEAINREIVRTEEICYPILVADERAKLRETPAP